MFKLSDAPTYSLHRSRNERVAPRLRVPEQATTTIEWVSSILAAVTTHAAIEVREEG